MEQSTTSLHHGPKDATNMFLNSFQIHSTHTSKAHREKSAQPPATSFNITNTTKVLKVCVYLYVSCMLTFHVT